MDFDIHVPAITTLVEYYDNYSSQSVYTDLDTI